MKIYTENSLVFFDFWAGARQTVEELDNEDLLIIESILEEIYPDGLDETTVNDIFWFENDWIAECLGFTDWDELCTKRKQMVENEV